MHIDMKLCVKKVLKGEANNIDKKLESSNGLHSKGRSQNQFPVEYTISTSYGK